jgi:hypothetical protein
LFIYIGIAGGLSPYTVTVFATNQYVPEGALELTYSFISLVSKLTVPAGGAGVAPAAVEKKLMFLEPPAPDQVTLASAPVEMGCHGSGVVVPLVIVVNVSTRIC